jgi:type VI secretion system secreted protein Hcp
MALTGYLTLSGESHGDVEGGCTQRGREKKILVYGVEHRMEIPHDVHTGGPTGQRIHHAFVITKRLDQASPPLWKMCATGERIPIWQLDYYRINEMGMEENYFTIKLDDSIVVNMRQYKPLSFVESSKPFHDMEEVSFAYRRITWEHMDPNKIETDDWKIPIF